MREYVVMLRNRTLVRLYLKIQFWIAISWVTLSLKVETKSHLHLKLPCIQIWEFTTVRIVKSELVARLALFFLYTKNLSRKWHQVMLFYPWSIMICLKDVKDDIANMYYSLKGLSAKLFFSSNLFLAFDQ